MAHPAKRNLLAGSLGWALSNLSSFDLRSRTASDGLSRLKCFAELALLVAECRVRHLLSTRQELEFQAFFSENVSQPWFAEGIIRRPRLASLYLLAFVSLEDAGVRCPHARELLERLLAIGQMFSRELMPFQRFERCYLLERGGFEFEKPDDLELFGDTFAARMPLSLTWQELDVYAFTHAILYLTDLGRRGSKLPVAQREKLLEAVELFLGVYLCQNHWDLVGELLMCAETLGGGESALAGLGWKALGDQQNTDGHIFDAGRAEREGESGERTDHFDAVYHPTLVSGLAAAVGLGSDRVIS
jgi:hypothetical protein